jgi:hypothetical protein
MIHYGMTAAGTSSPRFWRKEHEELSKMPGI